MANSDKAASNVLSILPIIMTYKIFSFFSGAGFLDLGFEQEGFEVSFVNEYHAPFLDAYQYARAKLGIRAPRYGYHLGSISDLLTEAPNRKLTEYIEDGRKDGSLIGFIGGPPCPDFSVAGKNRGKEGLNGKLTQTYFDLIAQQKPDFFLFENVKGLWKTKKHREYYEQVKTQLTDVGYQTVERLINAIEYGAPQDRERVILVGFRTESFRTDLETGTFDWHGNADYANGMAFLYEWADTSKFRPDSELALPVGIPIKLTVEYWFRKNDVEQHPNSRHHFIPRAGLKRFLTIPEGDVSKKSSKRLHRWRFSPTAAYGNNEVHLHPYKARRISVAEALAVQSLPKEFELPPYMTLSNMFKCVGNGVPFLAAKGLAYSLRQFLENQIHASYCNRHCARDRSITSNSGLQLY